MSMLNRAPHPAQIPHASEFHQTVDVALTREERRRVALASLTIMEQRFRLKLAQIAAEKRALLSTDYHQQVEL